MDSKSFGKHIKIARKSKGLTAEQLAELMDISVESLWQIEGGKSGTTLSKLIIICNSLDISPDFLFSKDLHPNLAKADSIFNRLYDKELNLNASELLLIEDIIDTLLANRKEYREGTRFPLQGN